jgi:putative flippase GtrA
MKNLLPTRRDFYLGLLAGLFIGILALPILKAAKPELFSSLAFFVVPLFTIATPIGLIVAYWMSLKIKALWQVAKFGVIGVLNTLVDLGILALLIAVFRSSFNLEPGGIFLDMTFATLTFYTLYKAISFIVANINSYFWNKYWTFSQNIADKTSGEFFQFLVVSVVGFLINVFVASFVFKHVASPGLTADQWGLIGGVFGTFAGLMWNFVGYKFWVFKK